jgi:hypothetical protein
MNGHKPQKPQRRTAIDSSRFPIYGRSMEIKTSAQKSPPQVSRFFGSFLYGLIKK